MNIREIEVIPLNMRIVPDVAPHLYRSGVRARSQVVLYRVYLDSGVVGTGEDMGVADDAAKFDASPYVGRNVLDGLRTISHIGVQMACYDAAGKALGVPAHVLMGRQVRRRIPLAYWTIDLPPSIFAAQAAAAAAQGYQAYKFKCRPWWDPIEQVEAASKVIPAGFKLWLDFNGHLREERLALPILRKLAEYECVGGFESPIPQRDAEGYRALRQAVDRPIAAHYGSGCCHVTSDPGFDRGVPALRQITEKLCDGFVLGGGDVETVRSQAAVAAQGHMPFWVQVVGSGLRAAWVAQLTSTCKAATLSHLAAHNLWEQDFVTLPALAGGWLPVPEGPGLGVEIDEAAVTALRDAPPLGDHPRTLSTVVYPDGLRWHFSGEEQRHEAFYFGDLPGFVRGIRLEVREDDGSAEFDALFTRCQQTPVVEKG